jgi:type I site-specific restriction-modification system R (restriction) subunit
LKAIKRYSKKLQEKEYRFLIVANKYQTGFDQPLSAYNVCGQET